MKLVCPSCGAINSADAWLNDANCREAMAKVAALPGALPKVTIGYLALFRPGERGLSWKKALRLAAEIAELVNRKYVHVHGKPDRDCPAMIWAQAMETMIEQRDRLSLPMPNHNYLCKVAWDLADQADRSSEYSRPRQQKRDGADDTPARIGGQVKQFRSPMDEYIDGDRDTEPSKEEMSEWYRVQMGG